MPERLEYCLLWLALMLFPVGCLAESRPGPSRSWVIDGLTPDSVKSLLTALPSDPVCGMWSSTADGARIAVIPGAPEGAPRSLGESFLIVMMRSPKVGLKCGTVMGWCTPAAKAGYYDCTMFSGNDGPSVLTSPRRFTLRLNDSSHLSLIVVRDGLEIVAWKMLPYMFRSLLRERHDRPRDLDGMIRLWPESAGMPVKPRYL